MATLKLSVSIENEELDVLTLSYTESVEQDNELRIRLNATQEQIDDLLTIGASVSVTYGYVGGDEISITNLFLSNVDITFSRDGVTTTIIATDRGNDMKKSSSYKVWKQKNLTEIATDIAKNWQLTPHLNITRTDPYKELPQAHIDDYTFLKNITQREGQGNYIMYINNGLLFITKRGIDKTSQRLFKYNDKDSGFISFRPRDEKIEATPATQRTKLVGDNIRKPLDGGIDLTPKQKFEGTPGNLGKIFNSASIGKEGSNIKLGKEQNQVTPNLPSSQEKEGDTEIAETIATTLPTREAINIARYKRKEGALMKIKGELQIVGDPTMVIDNVITIENIGAKYSGNWYIHSAKHTIGSGGYTTNLKVYKNATNILTDTTDNTPENKTIGTETETDLTEIPEKDTYNNTITQDENVSGGY